MNLQFYQEKLESNQLFKDFIKANPESFLSSAFFTLTITDKSQETEAQLDFFNKDKFAVFHLGNEVILKQEEGAKHNIPEKLGDSKLDINKLPEICQSILEKNNIQEKLIKIMAILTQQAQPVWSLNCITSSMSVIKMKLDDEANCLSCDKINLMDFVKKG